MTNLSEAQMKLAAGCIAAAKNDLDLSAVEIGRKAGYNEKVVRETIKAYPKKKEIVAAICGAVGLDLDKILYDAGLGNSENTSSTFLAPPEHGGYSKENYIHHVGSYTTVRPAYANAALLKCYQTNISWNDNLSRLCFSERNRDDDYGQDGQIYIPAGMPHMYLITIKKGWIRTVLVSQLVNNRKIMHGLILSQFNSGGASYTPICSPIIYLKENSELAESPPYGEIADGPDYDRFNKILHDTVHQSFVRILQPSL